MNDKQFDKLVQSLDNYVKNLSPEELQKKVEDSEKYYTAYLDVLREKNEHAASTEEAIYVAHNNFYSIEWKNSIARFVNSFSIEQRTITERVEFSSVELNESFFKLFRESLDKSIAKNVNLRLIDFDYTKFEQINSSSIQVSSKNHIPTNESNQRKSVKINFNTSNRNIIGGNGGLVA